MDQHIPESSQQPIFDLNVDEIANRNLWGAAGWARFLSVVVFIGIALVIIAFLSLRSQITATLSRFIPGMDGIGFAVGLLAAAVGIAVILFYFLINGAILVRKGLLNKDQSSFNNGLSSMKNYFIMYGVVAIITIILTILGLFVK